MNLEGLYCNGELEVSIESTEVHMSHWVNAPKVVRPGNGQVLLDLTQTMWDLTDVKDEGDVLLLTLREYPGVRPDGTQAVGSVSVDSKSGQLKVGAAAVTQKTVQKALHSA